VRVYVCVCGAARSQQLTRRSVVVPAALAVAPAAVGRGMFTLSSKCTHKPFSGEILAAAAAMEPAAAAGSLGETVG
jgi:hypothetical protein